MTEYLPPSVLNSMPKAKATDLRGRIGELFGDFAAANLAAGLYGARRPDPLKYAQDLLNLLGVDADVAEIDLAIRNASGVETPRAPSTAVSTEDLRAA